MTSNKTPDLITILLITSLQTISFQLENANYEITPSFTVQKKWFYTYTEESQLVIFILNKIESIFSCVQSNIWNLIRADSYHVLLLRIWLFSFIWIPFHVKYFFKENNKNIYPYKYFVDEDQRKYSEERRVSKQI